MGKGGGFIGHTTVYDPALCTDHFSLHLTSKEGYRFRECTMAVLPLWPWLPFPPSNQQPHRFHAFSSHVPSHPKRRCANCAHNGTCGNTNGGNSFNEHQGDQMLDRISATVTVAASTHGVYDASQSEQIGACDNPRRSLQMLFCHLLVCHHNTSALAAAPFLGGAWACRHGKVAICGNSHKLRIYRLLCYDIRFQEFASIRFATCFMFKWVLGFWNVVHRYQHHVWRQSSQSLRPNEA